LKLVAERDGGQRLGRVVVVEDYGEDGLGAAGVLDCLGREEDVVFGGGGIVASIKGGFGSCAGCFTGPFEEENYAVD
jgi:hypothetical protein